MYTVAAEKQIKKCPKSKRNYRGKATARRGRSDNGDLWPTRDTMRRVSCCCRRQLQTLIGESEVLFTIIVIRPPPRTTPHARIQARQRPCAVWPVSTPRLLEAYRLGMGARAPVAGPTWRRGWEGQASRSSFLWTLRVQARHL